MSSNRLDNCVRTYRKRAGFSQDELAHLLSAHEGTKISRYERFVRTPNLETALVCEAIFGVTVRELFAGLSVKAERRVRHRGCCPQEACGRERP